MASKNIVILSDGTGNSAAKLFKTNVWRMGDALDLSKGDQIYIYDDGVGTDRFKPLALLGGAVGIGLQRNVQQLYAFLCRTYRPGDNVYLFGFSRGAFTIRVLVGLIHGMGLVSGATERELQRNVQRVVDDGWHEGGGRAVGLALHGQALGLAGRALAVGAGRAPAGALLLE